MNNSGMADSSYTILRIKRKRTDEHLEALVVEGTKRRKSKGGARVNAGIFQFAETVEDDTWKDKAQADHLKSRISALVKENVEVPSAPQPTQSAATSSKMRPSNSPASRQYTVIQHEPTMPISSSRPTLPPKVHSSKDLPPSMSGFTIYDAIARSTSDEPVDPEMEKFQDLLQNYLKLHDMPQSQSSMGASQSTTDGDYVWDVFIHRNGIAPGMDLSNIATLTGLPPGLDGDNDSGSDSEYDEEDEDSNAEDFYKNDYPEEEESDRSDNDSGDMFHEHSDNEDDQDGRFDSRAWDDN